MFDAIGFICKYENEECDREEIVEGFQHLIDSGLVWSLQGSYGRTATELIRAGTCSVPLPKADPGVLRHVQLQGSASRANCKGDSCGD